MKKITLLTCLFLTAVSMTAQVLVEAESAILSGTTELTTATDGEGVTYITTQTSQGGTSPAGDDYVATYNVTFDTAGTYDLYVRLYIGSGGGSDDSFFVADGFGVKDPSDAAVWITHNETNRHGYVEDTDVVDGDYTTTDYNDTSKDQVWKWINLSLMEKAEAKINYTVASPSTLTFQIGSREDGLLIDKFVFGVTGTEYTVADLNAATLGFNQNISKVSSSVSVLNNTVTVSNVSTVTEVKVYSITGALVKSLSTKADTSFNLNPGVWIATLKTAEGQKSVKILCN